MINRANVTLRKQVPENRLISTLFCFINPTFGNMGKTCPPDETYMPLLYRRTSIDRVYLNYYGSNKLSNWPIPLGYKHAKGNI